MGRITALPHQPAVYMFLTAVCSDPFGDCCLGVQRAAQTLLKSAEASRVGHDKAGTGSGKLPLCIGIHA